MKEIIMNYKTIILCALLSGTMQTAWGMDQVEDKQSRSKRAVNGYAQLMRVQAECANEGVMIISTNKIPEFATIIPKLLEYKKNAAKEPSGAAVELAQELETALAKYRENKKE